MQRFSQCQPEGMLFGVKREMRLPMRSFPTLQGSKPVQKRQTSCFFPYTDLSGRYQPCHSSCKTCHGSATLCTSCPKGKCCMRQKEAVAKPICRNSCTSASLCKGFAGLELVPSHVAITVATLEKHRDLNTDL